MVSCTKARRECNKETQHKTDEKNHTARKTRDAKPDTQGNRGRKIS
jgi:hypothetical protein